MTAEGTSQAAPAPCRASHGAQLASLQAQHAHHARQLADELADQLAEEQQQQQHGQLAHATPAWRGVAGDQHGVIDTHAVGDDGETPSPIRRRYQERMQQVGWQAGAPQNMCYFVPFPCVR